MCRRLAILAMAASVLAATPVHPQSGDRLVYADFERVENGRPVSARGGFIQLTSYQESDLHKTTVKGAAGLTPPAPELVRIKKDDPNHAMKFDYALMAPNQWAGATVSVAGLPEQDGKPVADDVSEYKDLTLQLYTTGIETIRVEVISKGQGKDLASAHPQFTFKAKPGMNGYRLPLRSLAQPSYAEIRVDPKDILKRLTSINITAYCDQCRPAQGMVIVDNVAFEK